ncbi:MAG TPA: NAD(P)-dependent oxidoreductase [Gaiellales bacterium]|jgi:3-hydroxyisobutyrate dehydrogenase|nr:NAD(P)-dependent oxidoreductase [Gaiellales bacterium]
MPKQMTVAVLGVGGTMGLPMARNIARAGLRVRTWNRSPEKMRPLADDGAHLADDARAAVEGADVVITMLADADAVLAVMGDAIDAMREGVVWLQTSTIGEAGIEACAELAEGHDIRLVDAPLLGTKAPAEQGELIVLGSGPEGLRDGLAPIFDAIAQRTMWVGETGAGTRLKVVVNSWIVTVVEGGAETIALAEGMGVDPTLLFEALEGGALDLPYLRMKGEAIAARDFDPSFSLRLAAKDAALVQESAGRRDLGLPVLAAIRRRLEEGVPEHGDEDMSATFLTSAPGAVR